MDTQLDLVSVAVIVMTVTFSMIAVLVTTVAWFEMRRRRRGRLEHNYDYKAGRADIGLLRDELEHKLHKINDRLLATEDGWQDVNHLLVARQNKFPERFPAVKPAAVSEFVKSFGIWEGNLDVQDDLVFVLTPFHREYERTFDVVASVCRDLGLKCLRGDEQYVQGELLPHIMRQLVQARLVIANIQGRNPNVFYELGIAHALDKPTILICRTESDAPFDLRSKFLVLYKTRTQLKDELKSAIAKAILWDTASGSDRDE